MIEGEEVPVVDKVKYFGCILDEHVDLKVMVEDRIRAGSKALCMVLVGGRRVEGQVNGHTFL